MPFAGQLFYTDAQRLIYVTKIQHLFIIFNFNFINFNISLLINEIEIISYHKFIRIYECFVDLSTIIFGQFVNHSTKIVKKIIC
jgi:hypothetical protein